MIHKLTREHFVYEMSAANPAALAIGPGDTLVLETKDCFSGQIGREDMDLSELKLDGVNPATGPVSVRGAMPGDTLRVRVDSIELEGAGVICAMPGEGVLAGLVERERIRLLSPEKGRLRLFPGADAACNPMIGVIGVAPAGEAVSCGTPGEHGGNMDCNRIVAGAALYLPVFHPGGLLSVGDVHAVMGDGEIVGTGVEIPARVTLTVELLPGLALDGPVLESGSRLYTIASDRELSQAVRMAARRMHPLVRRARGLDAQEAAILMGALGGTEICQIVNPRQTARFSMPLELLEGWR